MIKNKQIKNVADKKSATHSTKSNDRSFSHCNFFSNNRESFSAISLVRNRKGWLEIVEAFVAILLVAGVILIILNRQSSQNTDLSDQIYNIEVSIIREIQTNNSLRESIANAPKIPVDWEDPEFPSDLRNKIISRIPNYLTCVGKICELNTPCSLSGASLEESTGKDVYSESGVISAILGKEVYRQLNLFCWTK